MPAWNEEGNVAATVAEIRDVRAESDVLVVDDGSTDRTAQEAAAAGAHVLRLPINLGVGGAMRAGFRFALEAGYGAVVQIDADGQHDPRGVDTLLEGLQRADLVIGARFDGRRGSATGTGPARRVVMRLLAWVVGHVVGERLTDTTSGFRASGPRALALFAREYPAEYLGDTVESMIIAARNGLAVTEVPVPMRPRRGGVPSQPPWRAALYLARALLVLALATMRRLPPRTGPQEMRA